MKNYRITVNGTAYDVAVEEMGASASAPVAAAPVAAAPAAPAAAPAAPQASGAKGGVPVVAPMPGKVLSIKASVGQSVAKGDVVLVLEAMKMENEIGAAEDGTIASSDVAEGASVEAGATLATLN